ncbi:MAG: peptidoglycan-binding protein [Devosia sp.]
MARAYPQSQSVDYDREQGPGEWQSLRHELVALLDQVDGQVSRSRAAPSLAERVQDMRYQVAEQQNDLRHRDALKSVQRAITRFEEPAAPPQMPPNPRDSLQAAINQIRSRQSEPAPRPMAPPARAPEAPLFDKLAHSVNGLSGRLEALEGEIKAQIKTGANVKDVADQVAQLAHVVELLAGAVGETGQVKRLEGQIASLGKIMSQGREMDIQTLTRRLDDVASTVGKLAELQVHYADRVQNPVESQAFQDGMHSIESSVRSVYDRIDALERQSSLSPQDLEHVTAEMARFTEAIRAGQQEPLHLVELVDALNIRIADIESGDRLLHGLRKDLSALRDAVIVSLTPRFDAIEQRMDALSTRDDMVEIGRQLGALGDRIGERPIDPGIGQLEAQVRQLVARMDQTGEQLSGLAKLYAEPGQTMMADLDAMADMVASRAAEAMQRTVQAPAMSDHSVNLSIEGLEQRITAMLQSMSHDPEVDALDGMQTGINEVNERLKRLEASLAQRSSDAAAEMPRRSDITTIIADAEPFAPSPRPRTDTMPRSPAAEAPLIVPAYPEPTGPVAEALEAKNGPRERHPGLDDDTSLAARYDEKPARPARPAGFEPESIATPPAPQPSPAFTQMTAEQSRPVAANAVPVTASSRNTFIEAARRAAQRQQPAAQPEVNANSLIGRALARFQPGAAAPKADAEPAPKIDVAKPAKVDKPKRKMFKPEPVAAPPAMIADPAPAQIAPSLEPAIGVDGPAPMAAKESFLSRNRKTILLAAAVVAIALLTLNLVAQRFGSTADSEAPVLAPTDAPATTGDISGNIAPVLGNDPTPSMPTRVIPMVDSLKTGSIDRSAAQGFSAAPQAMPNAFAPNTEIASADGTPTTPALEPLSPRQPSPVKVELPPDGVGPMDLRQSAANGDARAQFEVAAIYTEGRAIPQDYKAAATWYERAAAQGFAPAQYRLGSLYESGTGVTKDLNTAKLWYERAAEAGNRMSMHNLAALYAGGQLGKQQFDSAAKWFEEAASRGLTDSQFNLGMLYARGLGVPQSLSDSYKWFGIAALTGDKDATKARDDMARSLDAETMAKLNAEVAAFRPAKIDLAANFAPIGTWTKSFDPGETITSRDIVASVQKALGKLGYDVGTPDGVAGKKTADAIKAFEGATGMNEVGQINPRLLAVLGSQPV